MNYNYSHFPSCPMQPHLDPPNPSQSSPNSQKNEPCDFYQQTPDYPLHGRCQPRLIEVNPHEEANARWEKKSKLHTQDQIIKGIAVGALITLGLALFITTMILPFALPAAVVTSSIIPAIVLPGMTLGFSALAAGAFMGCFWFDPESCFWFDTPKLNYRDRDEANKISLKLKTDKLDQLKDLNIGKLKRYGFVDKQIANQLREFRKQYREDNKLIQKVENTPAYARLLNGNGDDCLLSEYRIAKQRQEGINAEWETFQRDVLADHLPCLTVRA